MNQPATRPLLFGLHDQPPAGRTVLAALGHLLAIVASIMTAPLLIASVLGLNSANTLYVINSALVVSGLATFIQVYRFGWLGSGLLAVQGTSFTFIGPMAFAAAYLDMNAEHAMVGVLLGSAAVAALLTMLAALFIQQLQTVITPAVTGTTIFLLGSSLVLSAFSNLQRAATSSEGGAALWVWSQAAFVLLVVVFFSTRKNPWLRLASICLALVFGFVFAALTQGIDVGQAPELGVFFLQLGRFPLGFDPVVLLLFLPIFMVSVTESIGDITATSMLSAQSIGDQAYWRRLRGGILADGFNTIVASFFGTFPNTTFSQNNGVIQITGVASRRVGMVLAGLLVVLGSLPFLSAGIRLLPPGVLHAATGFLFVLIALAGLRIIRTLAQARWGLFVLGVSSILAWLLTWVPEFVAVPEYLGILLGFPVATGAVLAMSCEVVRLVRRRVRGDRHAEMNTQSKKNNDAL